MFNLFPPHPENGPKYGKFFRNLSEFKSFLDRNWNTFNCKQWCDFAGGDDFRHGMVHNSATALHTYQTDFAPLQYEDVMKRVTKGWPEGAKLLSEKRVKIAERLDALVRKQKWDLTGHSLDVGRMLSGEPECFRRRKIIRDEPKMLTLAMCISVNAYETPETLINRTAYVAALVDELEKRGCRIKIIATGSSSSRYTSSSYANQTNSVVFKDFHETISSSVLATWCGTIEVSRRLLWLCKDVTGYSANVGRGDSNTSCNDKSIFSKADIWFPDWEVPPSEDVCIVWMYAMGFTGDIEWTPERRQIHKSLSLFAKELDKEFKNLPTIP